MHLAHGIARQVIHHEHAADVRAHSADDARAGLKALLETRRGHLAVSERGELVFTSLTKEAFPVIRYRTRDLTRLLPGTARTMRRMDRISGRSDDMLIIRGMNVFPSAIEDVEWPFPVPITELGSPVVVGGQAERGTARL